MFYLKKAEEKDADLCYRILDMGRRFQREQGFIQWTEEYPTYELVKEDIKEQKGYVLKNERDEIAAYMYINFDGDEYYEQAKDIWDKNEPYAVMHRLAIHDDFRNKGVADICFKLFEKLCLENGRRYIKIDTQKPNKRMQHIFEKNGYVYRGEVLYIDGLCIAYDKTII